MFCVLVLVLGFEATASLFDITLVTVAYLTWSTGGGLLQWFGCNYLIFFCKSYFEEAGGWGCIYYLGVGGTG